MADHLGRQIEAVGYRPALGFDGSLQVGAASADLLRQVEVCGPFGVGNAQPRFAIPAVRLERNDVVGGEHVRCRLVGQDGKRLKGIAFRAFDSPLGETLMETSGLPLHLGGKLKWDSWSGPEAVQFVIEDAAPSRQEA